MLRTAFAAGAALTTRTTTTASLSTLTAGTALSTGTALALRRAHLFHLLELLGCQVLLDLGLHLSFQVRHLFHLIGGQVQLLLGARRQQVKSALSALSAGATGAALTSWGTLPARGLITVLRCEEARGSAQCQREEDDFRFHDVFCVYCVFPAPAVCIDSMQ